MIILERWPRKGRGMRTIKFRAWDGKEFLPLTREVAFINDNGELQSRIEGVIFSQSTGLTDKHGKDIWEDDIVRDGDNLYRIRWARSLAQFALYWHNNEAPKGSNKEWRYEDSLSNSHLLEVIGNFWEHPNLLQEEK